MPLEHDAAYWRERAEEARAQADQINTLRARKTLFEIADNYDQLALQAERMRLTGQVDP
ncbi:MAG TPA: hypothetical protein VN668_18060 [Stellaceae bacterium]|nr:hypothetical protein [Stellaceae bacterium]